METFVSYIQSTRMPIRAEEYDSISIRNRLLTINKRIQESKEHGCVIGKCIMNVKCCQPTRSRSCIALEQFKRARHLLLYQSIQSRSADTSSLLYDVPRDPVDRQLDDVIVDVQIKVSNNDRYLDTYMHICLCYMNMLLI
jgi:hypothetical protein